MKMEIRILERVNLYQIAEWCGGGVQTVDVEDLTYTGRVAVTYPESVKVPTAGGLVYATPGQAVVKIGNEFAVFSESTVVDWLETEGKEQE